MAHSSYHQLHSFQSSDPASAPDLYSAFDYDNRPVHPFGSSTPKMRTIQSNSNDHSSNKPTAPSTEPPMLKLYTAHSNGTSYHKPPQHSINDIKPNRSLQSANHSDKARPPHPIDPPTKPLVHSSHTAIPEPLAMQTPRSRVSQRRHQNLQRYVRVLSTLSNALTTLFSAAVLAITLYVSITFESTKDEIRDGRTAWPQQTKLWPVLLLLVCAALTLLLAAGTLGYYCCAYGKAKRSWKLTLVRYVIHIGAWLVVSALYRYEKGATDLWGWSCSAKAVGLQAQFDGVVDFSSLCSTQSKCWDLAIAEVVAKILFAMGHFIIYRKTRRDEKERLADGVGGAVTDFIEDNF